VPRYHFVVKWPDRERGDPGGTVLQDEEEARRFAARIIRGLKESGGYHEPDVFIVVRHDQGKEVLTLSFPGLPVF
jgi:uncharacterized protein DUF6894